jgi:hypothetical protein
MLPVIVLPATLLTLIAINTLQSGSLIIDKSLNKKLPSINDFNYFLQNGSDSSLLKLIPSKMIFTQLYLRSKSPEISDVVGYKYRGFLLPVGICWKLSDIITNLFFGPGKWYGKEFSKENFESNDGSEFVGSNIFFGVDGDFIGSRQFEFSIVKNSFLDKRPAMNLKYSKFNRFHPVAFGMIDELRKLDDDGRILLGCGSLALSGGLRNFAPFLLVRSKR